MFEQLKMQVKNVSYHRIPMSDDQAPTEQVPTTTLLLNKNQR